MPPPLTPCRVLPMRGSSLNLARTDALSRRGKRLVVNLINYRLPSRERRQQIFGRKSMTRQTRPHHQRITILGDLLISVFLSTLSAPAGFAATAVSDPG